MRLGVRSRIIQATHSLCPHFGHLKALVCDYQISPNRYRVYEERSAKKRAYQGHVVRKVSSHSRLFTSDGEQIVAVDGGSFVVHLDIVAHSARER
jgi:hypothetical protein